MFQTLRKAEFVFRFPNWMVSFWMLLFAVSSLAEGRLYPEQVLNRETMKPRGQWYESSVPDTLDLAERARLSINVLTQNMDPSRYYLVYQSFRFGSSPIKLQGGTWNLPHKNARALPLLRAMSGSEFNLDVEYDLMKTLLNQIHEDGLCYVPVDSDGAPKGTSYPVTDGILAQAVMNWYGRDENPAWLDWIKRISDGLCKVAVQIEDRAYYPLESGVSPDGTWQWTRRGKPTVAYTPPDEPVSDQQGLEGTSKFDNSMPIQAMVFSYRLRNDLSALEMARKISRYLLKPSLWENTNSEGYPGNEHGIFAGHHHGNTATLCALLDLAVADNNDWLKEFVREAYDHDHRNGISRMGWYPAWLIPKKGGQFKQDQTHHSVSTPDDMPMFAVKLSDAGLGDYWDDVDYLVRNHFTEMQFVNLELMREIAGLTPENDNLLRRFLGGYTQGGLTELAPVIYGGNSAVFAQALYYAWHGITRFDHGVATVNLFLNRASSWMDIDSYLPYEGKVVLRNKLAQTALVRIPGWTDMSQVKSYRNDKLSQPQKSGHYLVFQNLKKGDQLRLEFPLEESTDIYTIHGVKFTVSFRGSTVLDIQPRHPDPSQFPDPHYILGTRKYPLYQREHFRSGKAPMKTVRRFVADRIIPIQ